MTLIVSLFSTCVTHPPKPEPIPGNSTIALDISTFDSYIEWTCEEGEYNPLASLFFNTEAGVIRLLFHHSPDYFAIDPSHLFLFGLTWYFWTITTYGVVIPAGLFLPGIIMGGALGRLYTMGIQQYAGYEDVGEMEQNTVLGAAAMLSGYCRLTYSLTVIMLETT